MFGNVTNVYFPSLGRVGMRQNLQPAPSGWGWNLRTKDPVSVKKISVTEQTLDTGN